MRKKPHKAEEPKAAYPAKKPATAAPAAASTGSNVRYADPALARKSMDKVFRVHKDLLRKLAQ